MSNLRCFLCLSVVAAGFASLPGVSWAGVDDTWSTIQHGILGGNCASCHSAGTSFAAQSGLVLTPDVAYDELITELPKNSAARADGLRRVSTLGGQSGLHQSFLWEKINAPEQEHYYNDHPGYGAIMPLGRPPLTNGELAYVREWIIAGAPQTGSVASLSLLDDTTRYEPPPFAPLAPPVQGIQLHLGPFDVWPSEVNDREFLYYEPLETTEDLFVTQYEIAYRPGSHHFILYNYPAGTPTPPPNVYRDLRNQQGQTNLQVALQLGNLFPFQMFVGTQTPNTNYHLPPGVALRLPAGSGFDLNSHSVNRTDATAPGEVYVNLHTVDRDEVQFVADQDNFGNFDISLPPQQVTTLSETFTFGEQRHLIQLWSHSHEHTVEFRIEGVGGEHDGELLYWTNDWEHPPLFHFDPPLTFEAGDQVRLVTTYDNWTDETIEFGPLSSDEMQFMFYIYYTGDLSTPDLLAGDINGDDEVDRADAALFAQYFGMESGATWGTGDFDGDGKTTVSDLAMLQASYGSRLAGSPMAATFGAALPEPTGFVVVAMGLLAISIGGRVSRRVRCRVGAGVGSFNAEDAGDAEGAQRGR